MGFFSDVIGGALDTVTGGLFSDFSGKSQQDDANAKAMQAWHIANDYNHPVNQMKRLEEAGLNKNLVYGSGSVAGNTTGAPALVGGQVSTMAESIFKPLGQMMNVLQGNANIRNTIAQTGAHNAAAAASGAQAANLGAQAALNETRNKYEEKSLIADLDYKQALAKKTNAEASIAQGEADLFGAVGGVKGASGAAKSVGFLGKTGRWLRGVLK